MKAIALTNVGNKRSMNQDFYYCSDEPVGILPNLYIVADGMGGHSYGEVASSLAISVIVDYLQNAPVNMPGYLLEQAIEKANREVYKKSVELETMGMGTTIVLAVLIVVMNLVSDILYKIVDPRINLE